MKLITAPRPVAYLVSKLGWKILCDVCRHLRADHELGTAHPLWMNSIPSCTVCDECGNDVVEMRMSA